MKTFLTLLLLMPSLSWGKIIDERYCLVLENKIKDNIGSYFAYTKNISNWSNKKNLDKQQYELYQRLLEQTREMLERVKQDIHTDSITWANLCK